LTKLILYVFLVVVVESAAKYGENCYEACKRVDLRCDAHYFNMINNCDGLRQVFGDPSNFCFSNKYFFFYCSFLFKNLF